MRQIDRAGQWFAAMRSQDLDRAWRIGDQMLRQRRKSAIPKHTGPRHLQQIWRGESLEDARVLVRCYHGLGDTIQFIRFATPLRRIARQVIVWCQPELQSLVARVAGVDDVLPLHDGTVEAGFDVDIEVMELPHALRVTKADLGHGVPYLSVRPEPVVSGSDDFRVGVVWKAGEWDTRRSIPQNHLEPLTAIKNLRLYSLHPDADVNDGFMAGWGSAAIDTLAARMAALDLIITVDTMSAHLAGALGVPTWTLLHSEADWRWGRGTHCVWYPTMRLFRQNVSGDWTSPLLQVANELRNILVRART